LDSDEALWKKAMKVKGARGIQLFANGWESQFVRDYKTPKRDAGSDEVEKHRGQEAGRTRRGDKCNEILHRYGIRIMIKMKMTWIFGMDFADEEVLWNVHTARNSSKGVLMYPQFLRPFVFIAGAAILMSSSPLGAYSPAQEQSKPEPFLVHAKLEVVLPDFPAQGLILDIGGGGEGVIGRLKGKQVVAVDLLKRELEEAPGEPLLKIVMDARDLKFLDKTFPTATVFFTFMYINPADHPKVFQELHRVLASGGRLLIWDAEFPPETDPKKLSVLFPLHITLPKTEINTGYGVKIVKGQGLAHFVDLAQKTGFEVIAQKTDKGWFQLELKKAD
jgi:SAM-dependent methyltransferase